MEYERWFIRAWSYALLYMEHFPFVYDYGGGLFIP